jgi:hypothetical protein
MTNLDSLVDQSYASTDPASFKDEAGNQLSETNAKAKMKRDYHDQVTRHAAQTNSYDFMTRLLAGHDKDHPITQPHLAAFAATNGLKVVTTEPFDVQNPPATLQIPAQLHPMLFQLEFGDPDDQYKVFPATNAFLLVGLEKKYPAESQPLEAVRAKVTEDCRLNQAMELVKNAGNKFEAAARAGLAAGQSFDAICASQGIKPQVLTPFALTTRSIPEIDDKDLYQGIAKVAYQLPTGQPSPFLALATGGLIVCVQSRTPLDDAIVERDIPAFLAQRRRDLQIAAFSLWLGKELRAHVMEPQKAAPPS